MNVSCSILLTVQHVLIRPDIRGLEDDDNVPPTPSPVGLDFSQPWHASVVASKELMLSNLHMCHPTMKLMLEMGHDSLGKILLINCLAYRSQGQLEFETLRNNIILESEKTEEKLKNRSEEERNRPLRYLFIYFHLNVCWSYYYPNLRLETAVHTRCPSPLHGFYFKILFYIYVFICLR